MKIGIVVTGLPASGKTTVARNLANDLSYELIDKDEFLEGLYELNDVRTWEDRKILSRQSDVLFQKAAEESDSAVLVSHWKPLGEGGESGTSTDWLNRVYTSLIEVYCSCPSNVAFERFLARKRHPSHLDQQRDRNEMAQQFLRFESRYPLGIGPLVKVDTNTNLGLQTIVEELRLLVSSTEAAKLTGNEYSRD